MHQIFSMSKIENNKGAITERFMMICEEALQTAQVKTRTEFAKSVGEHQQNLAAMESGSRSPTLDQVAKACELYGYSPTWLILNLGPKKMKETEQLPIEERLSQVESDIARIKRHLKRTAR